MVILKFDEIVYVAFSIISGLYFSVICVAITCIYYLHDMYIEIN